MNKELNNTMRMTDKAALLREKMQFPWLGACAGAAAFLFSTAALAATSGTSMPWETPLQTVADSITGPVAKAIGVIAIATTGLGFAFSEGGSVLRRGLGIVFGLAIAFTASTFLTSFFSITSGAVIP